MRRPALFNRREKISLLTLIIIAIITLAFIFWKSNLQQNPLPTSIEGWVTYSDQDIPFTFDHPKDWSISKDKREYNMTFIAMDQTSRQDILAVTYGKPKPNGLSAGISSCQGYVKSPKCSYITNPIVSNFFHIEGESVWRSNNPYKDGKITLNLIKQDQMSREILIKLGESIRAKEK